MKKIILMGAGLLSVLLLGGCSDDWGFESNRGMGNIAPVVRLDTKVESSKDAAPGSRAGAAPAAEDLSLRLTKADGSKTYELGTIASYDISRRFPVGDYIIEAYYGDPSEEGFEMPAYKGSQKVTVADSRTTEVGFSATQANAMVSVTYTDDFKNYMTDWSAKVNSVDYARDELRPAYVAPGNVRINISFTKPNGNGATLALDPVTAEPRYHYHVTVDVKGGAADAAISVSFDENFATETVDIDISDKVLSAPVPTIEAQGFTPGDAVTNVSGMPVNGNLSMSIMALAGIKSAVLETSSEYLLAHGWPESVDLANPGAQLTTLQNFGLAAKGLWGNPGELAQVDFTGLIPNIKSTEGDNTSVFTLSVVDKFSRSSEPLEFRVNIEGVQLELAQTTLFEAPGLDYDVLLDYNGVDVENNVNIEYLNNYAGGVWVPVPVKTVTEEMSRGTERYRLTLAIPSTQTGILYLRAVCKDVISGTLKVDGVPFALECNENDVFAKSASLSVVPTEDNEAPDCSSAKILLSTDGVNYSEAAAAAEGNVFNLSGLTPGQTYYARVLIDAIRSAAVSFTTESELQIPNGNLDADVTIAASGNNWQRINFEGWGTNNEMATKDGANIAYVRISLTKQTDDAHSGKAARISTQGWGSGNSAPMINGRLGTCNHIDAGLLHLGSNRTTRPSTHSGVTGPITTDDLDCGIAFASRPSAVTFWHKYEKKNANDYGLAQAYVYDAAGNVIASGTANLSETAYTQTTINLSYAAGAAKAARLYVCFLSTHGEEFLVKDTNYISGPPAMNLTNGEYSGSRLYIDDVELTY